MRVAKTSMRKLDSISKDVIGSHAHQLTKQLASLKEDISLRQKTVVAKNAKLMLVSSALNTSHLAWNMLKLISASLFRSKQSVTVMDFAGADRSGQQLVSKIHVLVANHLPTRRLPLK